MGRTAERRRFLSAGRLVYLRNGSLDKWFSCGFSADPDWGRPAAPWATRAAVGLGREKFAFQLGQRPGEISVFFGKRCSR